MSTDGYAQPGMESYCITSAPPILNAAKVLVSGRLESASAIGWAGNTSFQSVVLDSSAAYPVRRRDCLSNGQHKKQSFLCCRPLHAFLGREQLSDSRVSFKHLLAGSDDRGLFIIDQFSVRGTFVKSEEASTLTKIRPGRKHYISQRIEIRLGGVDGPIVTDELWKRLACAVNQ